MIGVRRPAFESQLCHFQALPLGQVISPFRASPCLPGLLQDSEMTRVVKALCKPKSSLHCQLLLQGARGGGPVSNSPLFRVSCPKGKTVSWASPGSGAAER